jgi:DNA-binding transcriptional regulator YhcF (GntR family)
MLVELGFDPSTYPGAGSHADQAPPGFEKAWPRMSEMSKAAVRARLSVSAQPKLPDHPPLPTMKQARAEITESTRRQAIEALKKSVSDIESAGYRLKDVVTLTADDMKNASALQIEELLLRKKLKKLNERRTIAEGLASKAKSMEMKAATAQKTMDELVKRLAATQLELEAITARHEAVMRGEDFEG